MVSCLTFSLSGRFVLLFLRPVCISTLLFPLSHHTNDSHAPRMFNPKPGEELQPRGDGGTVLTHVLQRQNIRSV